MRALFGGSFDPVHVGHLIVAEHVREAAGLDEVLWMPAATSPFKAGQTQTPAETRLRWVKAAIDGHPQFRVSDLEIRAGGLSYTVDTIETLAEQHPDTEWSLILGGDSLAGFPKWKAPRRILSLARLLVYRRPGTRLDALPDWVLARTRFIEVPALIPISSTDIRTRAQAGQSIRYLVPEPIRKEAAHHYTTP
ncbi:MAG: nicotinate (nicotinamide) nucleotide adenylyltransferase [Bacteroidota bacterium]